MPSYWILKTEPSAYSFEQLVRDRKTTWDGVKNPVALKHLRAMQPGDEILIYHTGDEKQCVGRARVVSGAYADPRRKDPKLAVVDIEAGASLPRPVTLATIKGDRTLSGLPMVRMPRLSVVPVTPAQWQRLLEMGG